MSGMTAAPEPTDGQLAALLADPDQRADAFRTLYDRHAQALLAYAAGRTRHRAEALCQKAWLAAVRHHWGPDDNVRAWLFGVVTNRVASVLKAPTGSLVPVGFDPATDDPTATLLGEERTDLLKRCREKLRRKKRVWDAVIESLLTEEAPTVAAKRLGMTRADFETRKSRALDALGQCAGPDARWGESTGTLAIATIPSDAADRPRWLDGQLVGDRVGDLVEELRALTVTRPADGPIADLLGDNREAVLADGTAGLPPPVRQRLLESPDYLLDLQALVLLEGRPYWDVLPRPERVIDIANRSRDQFVAGLTAPPVAPVLSGRRAFGPNVRQWLVPVAVISSVALVVCAIGWWPRPPAGPTSALTWGWAKPGALPADGSADNYYAALAAEGAEWFDVRPDDRAGLARRINELRQGCSVLLVTDHPPLSADRSRELKDHFRGWANQVDTALVRLESGDDLVAVRADVDGVVTAIVAYLNLRQGS
jgi:DNA-directed RNA polymerase specialized sigma24 family protein